MTTTPNIGLTKDAESGELYSVARVNDNSDRLDAYCGANRTRIIALENTVSTATMSSTSEDNPTYGTDEACNGLLLTASVPGSDGVGVQLFAGTSGAVFARAKSGSSWKGWARIPAAEEAT